MCKECGCHYTVSQRGYPEHIRRKVIQLYLEGNGFRSIERILKVSHVSVINWVKKAGAKLEEVPKKDEKVEVLELDKLCVNLKNIWLWTAVDRDTKRLFGFQIGTRETKYFQKLTDKISHIDVSFYESDHWHAYNLIEPAKHLTGKAHTYTVERMNRLLVTILRGLLEKLTAIRRAYR